MMPLVTFAFPGLLATAVALGGAGSEGINEIWLFVKVMGRMATDNICTI